jgi:quercetin dioxygenase-like cupin family protein
MSMTGFQVVRPVDSVKVNGLGPDERMSQKLINHVTGGAKAEVSYVVTPPGQGSPRGPHVHKWEQIFYLLEGTMTIEVEGKRQKVEAGSLIVFREGVRHRNWNETDARTVHLSINTPLPLKS